MMNSNAQMPKAVPHITRRHVLFALDSRFTVKWKFLFDAMPHDYTGYIDIWDTIPWQEVAFDDGITRDHNYASQAQFRPSYGGTGDYIGIFAQCVASGLPEDYCHNCQGLVGDLIALLEADGIADDLIDAQYLATEHTESTETEEEFNAETAETAETEEELNAETAETAETELPEEISALPADSALRRIPLRNLPFKEFNTERPFPETFPCGFARPMTYRYRGRGHLGDNGEACFFVRESNSYDGTEGLNAELEGNHRHEFWSDVAWFIREITTEEISDTIRESIRRSELMAEDPNLTPQAAANMITIGKIAHSAALLVGIEPPTPASIPEFEIPADAKLAIYFQACGSICRIRINGVWHILSDEPFPGYGNPYIGFCFRGKKFTIPLSDCGLHTGAGETNEFVIEYFAIRGEGFCANVIFAFEYTETIHEEEPMAEKKKAKKKPRKGRAIGDYFARWNQMLAALTDELQANPHLQDDYDALEALLPQVMAKDAEQEIEKGKLKTITQELKALIKEADKHFMALYRMLKAKFGPKAPELTKYVSTSQAEVDKTKEGFGDKEPEQAEEK